MLTRNELLRALAETDAEIRLLTAAIADELTADPEHRNPARLMTRRFWTMVARARLREMLGLPELEDEHA